MDVSLSSPSLHDTSADLSYNRATLYSALALGFRPPSQETVERLLSQEGTEFLARAAAVLDDHPSRDLARRALQLAVRRERSLSSLAASYWRLFGHTARGIVSPYETEYGDEALFQQPQEMGDLAGFYRAFGLILNAAAHERLDHVSCECEFMCFLALKEAYALEHDDSAMLEETRKASRLFLRDHLGRFGPAFARQLARADHGGFYGALGNFCSAFLSYECDRVVVTAGPVELGLRPATDDRVPMACGSGTECAVLPGACGPEEVDES
jgi:DMSO reductase family type II enzyme chaperone